MVKKYSSKFQYQVLIKLRLMQYKSDLLSLFL